MSFFPEEGKEEKSKREPPFDIEHHDPDTPMTKKERLQKAVEALSELGIDAEAPDQSGNEPGFRDRLVLNIRGVCIDELAEWVCIELRYLDSEGELPERVE